MMAPLFFIDQKAAYMMFIATMFSFSTGVILYKKHGMSRLLGIMHAPWIVSVYFLVESLPTVSMNNPFGIWVRVALILTSIGLILDIKDVFQYMRDQRQIMS